jgi:hypothetical protein
MNKGFVYSAIVLLLMIVGVLLVIPQNSSNIEYNKEIFPEIKIRLSNYNVSMQSFLLDSNWETEVITNFDGNSTSFWDMTDTRIIHCGNSGSFLVDENTIRTTVMCDVNLINNNEINILGNVSKEVVFYKNMN